MTKIANANFKGASGTSYPFEVYPANSNFNDVSAVYVLSKRTVNAGKGSHSLIYIGEAEKLGERIRNHEKWPCANSNGANAVCVLQAASRQERLAIETDLRHANNTPCNDQ